MRHRSPARWLAPVALVVFAVSVAGVIGSGLRSDERSPTAAGPSSSDASTRPISASGSGPGGKRRRTYRVRAGDTLSAISIRTGVPLARLRRLNPKVDTDALQTGQRIKLLP